MESRALGSKPTRSAPCSQRWVRAWGPLARGESGIRLPRPPGAAKTWAAPPGPARACAHWAPRSRKRHAAAHHVVSPPRPTAMGSAAPRSAPAAPLLLLLLLLRAERPRGAELTFELPDSAKQCFHEDVERGVQLSLDYQVGPRPTPPRCRPAPAGCAGRGVRDGPEPRGAGQKDPAGPGALRSATSG